MSEGLTIQSFDVITIEIPMRMSVRHSLAERSMARNILVRAAGSDGQVGWGESCPREYVTGETLDSVRHELRQRLLPGLLGRIGGWAETRDRLISVLDGLRRDQQAAFCAAELAVLDLAGQVHGSSAGDVVGPVLSPKVHYSGVIATEELDGVQQQCAFMAKFGARKVKVKVGESLDKNLQILTTAREILGPDVQLRIDANCAWSATEALRQLEAMSEFQLAGVEQPLPADDLAGLAEVTAAGLTPVVVDESLCSTEDAQQLIDHRACNAFNLRVSKCGGLINCGRLYQMARDAGLACQLGAQVGETGILSAAGRHLATRLGGLWFLEGSYGSMLLESDVTDPDTTIGPGGVAPVLESPGLGVGVVAAAVERCRVESFEVRT